MSAVYSSGAETLAGNSFSFLDTDRAMGNVRDVFDPRSSRKSDGVFAVIVRDANGETHKRSYLTVVNEFLQAYWRTWTTLSRISNSAEGYRAIRGTQFRVLEDPESSGVYVYLGQTDAQDDLEKQMATRPGIYVIPSRLDRHLLDQLDLPLLPPRFLTEPVVVRVTGQAVAYKPWTALKETLSKRIATEIIVERDTSEWRDHFMDEYASLTSSEVAEEAGSVAKYAPSLASRWATEGKIFRVQYKRKAVYPKFQFLDGSPSPVIGKVIGEFPKHATGWDYAYFFTTPNTYIGGRKPVGLIKSDPDQLVSLARSFANPADAF
jgi:hypothetical protein